MNIARRLQLIALLVMLALGCLSWFSISRLSSANADLSYVTDNTVPSISTIKEIQTDFYALHSLIQAHVLNTDDGKMSQIEQSIASLHTKMDALLSQYESGMISNEEDRQLVADDRRLVAQYGKASEDVLRLSRENKNVEAREAIDKELAPLFEQLSQAIDKHVHFNIQQGDAVKLRGEQNADSSMQALLFISVGAGALTLVLFLWLFRQVANPLRLAMATLSEIQRDLNFTLRANVSQQDEIGQTLTAVNRLLDTLQQTFTEFSVGSLQIKSTAESLSQAAQHMAESASQANDATSLIAAGVEEMSVSITDISQRTQETSRITNESGKLASDGGATIERTVLAINDIADAIRQASRDVTALGEGISRIGGVVNVINDVAGQTNLLALNAAIEAARPVSRDAALRWSPTRCASWRSGRPSRPRRSQGRWRLSSKGPRPRWPEWSWWRRRWRKGWPWRRKAGPSSPRSARPPIASWIRSARSPWPSASRPRRRNPSPSRSSR